jgi:hypothetical protein
MYQLSQFGKPLILSPGEPELPPPVVVQIGTVQVDLPAVKLHE